MYFKVQIYKYGFIRGLIFSQIFFQNSNIFFRGQVWNMLCYGYATYHCVVMDHIQQSGGQFLFITGGVQGAVFQVFKNLLPVE